METNRTTCCFTGHRALPAEKLPQIQKRLTEEITHLILQGVTTFLAGGALGFDTLAAQAVLQLKEDYPHIRLVLILPCATQDARWSTADRQVYRAINQRADQVVCLSQSYSKGCMFRRNRALADNSRYCICYLSKPTGGTRYTVDYARNRGIPVINIADYTDR